MALLPGHQVFTGVVEFLNWFLNLVFETMDLTLAVCGAENSKEKMKRATVNSKETPCCFLALSNQKG